MSACDRPPITHRFDRTETETPPVSHGLVSPPRTASLLPRLFVTPSNIHGTGALGLASAKRTHDDSDDDSTAKRCHTVPPTPPYLEGQRPRLRARSFSPMRRFPNPSRSPSPLKPPRVPSIANIHKHLRPEWTEQSVPTTSQEYCDTYKPTDRSWKSAATASLLASNGAEFERYQAISRSLDQVRRANITTPEKGREIPAVPMSYSPPPHRFAHASATPQTHTLLVMFASELNQADAFAARLLSNMSKVQSPVGGSLNYPFQSVADAYTVSPEVHTTLKETVDNTSTSPPDFQRSAAALVHSDLFGASRASTCTTTGHAYGNGPSHYLHRSPLSGFADLVHAREAANVHEMTEEAYRNRLLYEERMYHFGSGFRRGSPPAVPVRESPNSPNQVDHAHCVPPKSVSLEPSLKATHPPSLPSKPWSQNNYSLEYPRVHTFQTASSPTTTLPSLQPYAFTYSTSCMTHDASLLQSDLAYPLGPAAPARSSPASTPRSPKKTAGVLRSPKSPAIRRHCISCGSDQSPCWRPSWSTLAGQLCNSCGLRYKKTGARCLSSACGRIPAKGEWTTMKKRGKCVYSETLREVCYKCLHCDSAVEVRVKD